MHAFLGVPILYKEEALGNLYLTEKIGKEEFTPEDESLIVLFADQAAIAIKNARRFVSEQEARARAEIA